MRQNNKRCGHREEFMKLNVITGNAKDQRTIMDVTDNVKDTNFRMKFKKQQLEYLKRQICIY